MCIRDRLKILAITLPVIIAVAFYVVWERKLIGWMPVSYTHLDVYKRQVLVHPATSNEEGALLARLAAGLNCGNLDHRIAQQDLSDGAQAQAFATVSYTHLDVYKRQEFEYAIVNKRFYVDDAVSYTHLDVYKRQVRAVAQSQPRPGDVEQLQGVTAQPWRNEAQHGLSLIHI